MHRKTLAEFLSLVASMECNSGGEESTKRGEDVALPLHMSICFIYEQTLIYESR